MKFFKYSIYLIIFCLPLYLIRFQIFNLPVNIIEIMIFILFVVWVGSELRKKSFNKCREKINRNYNFIIPILLILVGVSIACFFSWNFKVSLGIWKAWFIVPLLFFIVLISTIRPKDIKNVFWVFSFSVLMINLISLFQHKVDAFNRLQGIYVSPNYLAMYITPALFFILWLFLQEKRKILKIILIFIFILTVFVLYKTFSFGAWFGVIVGFFFWLCFFIYKKHKKRLFYLIIILTLMFGMLLLVFKISSGQGEKSFNARLLIWQKSLEIFKSYPFIGIGPGTFHDYFLPYPKWGVPQPHNVYLAFLVQTGLVGFIGFIWLLVWFYKNGLEIYKKRKTTVVLMSVMTYFLIHGLIDTVYWKNDLAVFFWLIIGIMEIIKKP